MSARVQPAKVQPADMVWPEALQSAPEAWLQRFSGHAEKRSDGITDSTCVKAQPVELVGKRAGGN